MELMLIEPRTGQERYWPAESREKLAQAIERELEIVEWCRKDVDNREALLEGVRAVEGKDGGIADGLELLFREGGDVGVEEFAGAVQRVLVGGGEVADGIAEGWLKERAAKEEEERRKQEEEERWLHTPGRAMTLRLPGGAEMEMVWCPPGSFMMGSPENEEGRRADETQHRVTLTTGFWLAKYPVTKAQWKSVTGSTPSWFTHDEKLPVEYVSWKRCIEFCAIAGNGLRLPTEAEWEYACRAGSSTALSWGNAQEERKANFGRSKVTTPVGFYEPNAWGLHDMHGNVWEWCADWYGDYPGGAVTDPKGPDSGSERICRGGSWEDHAWCCRSACRNEFGPDYRSSSHGFRPARTNP